MCFYWKCDFYIMWSQWSSETHHLQQRQVPNPNIVIVDLHILPADLGKVCLDQSNAFRLVVNNFCINYFLRSLIKTVRKLSRKQIHSHDAEDQPKD